MDQHQDYFIIKAAGFARTLKLDLRNIHVTFHHRGIGGTPGHKRIYERQLKLLWEEAGAISGARYESGYTSCVVTFYDAACAALAVKRFNNISLLKEHFKKILLRFKDQSDAELYKRMIKLFFVEHDGCMIRVVTFAEESVMVEKLAESKISLA